MAIELKIGTRGKRKEFEETYTRSFLEDHGLMKILDKPLSPSQPWAVYTKHGWMCSFSIFDVLTYMGRGIWDLRVYKPSKEKERFLTKEEKKIFGVEF